MGFKFQFITLAGFHQTNYAIFDFANRYKDEGMYAYSLLQEAEFDAENAWIHRSSKHQREVNVGYFDAITTTLELFFNRSDEQGQPKKTSSKRPKRHQISVFGTWRMKDRYK